MIHDVFTQVFRVQKDNTLCFVNFGHLADFKDRPFEVVHILQDIGFKLHDTIIWVKNHFTPLRGNNLNNLFEYVFMFVKGRLTKNLDRLSIGVPYVDKSNAKRWKGAGGNDLRCGGNVWHIPYETIQSKDKKLHPDRFPIGLPDRCIRLANLPPQAVVLDPFMGSGTTALAALRLGKQYYGVEQNMAHVNRAQERLTNDNSRPSAKIVDIRQAFSTRTCPR